MSSTPTGSNGQSGQGRGPGPVRIEPILSAAPAGAPAGGPGMAGAGAVPRQPGGPGAPPARRSAGGSSGGGGRSWLRIIGGTLAALVVLLGGAVAAVYLFVSPDRVKDRVVREVKERTGRDLTIAGTPRISIWPNIAVSMSNVALSNPPGLAGPPTVTMAALEADVQLWPLLSREIVIDRILLREPVVDLRVDGTGRRNWDFAEWLIPGTAPDRVRYAQAAQSSRSDAGAPRPPRTIPPQLETVKLGSLQVVNGTVRYSDVRAKVTEEVKALDMTASAETIAAPLDAKGSLSWRGETLQFTVRLAPLRAALEEKPVAVAARINGQAVEAAYDGNATFAADLVLDGRLSAKSDAPDRLARLAGRTIDPQALAGGVRITTGVKTAAQSVTLSDARLDALGATTTGTVTVDTKGARPHLRGNLRFSELDVNKLQRLAGIEPAQRPQQQANRPRQPGPGSLEDIVKQGPAGPAAGPAAAPAARPRPDARRGGWSMDPIDTAFLGLADADLKIQFGKLSAASVTTGPGQATIAHRDRAADVTVEDIQLYQGRGRGRVTVNGTGQQVQVGANILGENLTAQNFFKDFGGPEWLFGRLRVALAVTAQGQSEYQLVQSLNGRGELTIADGWVIGFNVAELLRNLGQGRLAGLEAQPSQKTDFSEAAATFAITNGVARNNDLRVASPLMRVGGAGSLNLAERTVDYTLRPRLVATTQGQGAAADAGGLEIPVRVTGPVENPALTPDLSALVKDPNQALEAIKRIDPKAAEGALKGILGGDGEAQQKARDLLNQFLKR